MRDCGRIRAAHEFKQEIKGYQDDNSPDTRTHKHDSGKFHRAPFNVWQSVLFLLLAMSSPDNCDIKCGAWVLSGPGASNFLWMFVLFVTMKLLAVMQHRPSPANCGASRILYLVAPPDT